MSNRTIERRPYVSRILGLALITLALLLTTGQAVAQNFPGDGESITIIVNRSQGGSIDSSARVLANHFSDALGVPVVIENRPGAGGRIGISEVARASADGYTLGTFNAPGAQLGAVLYDPAYEATEMSYLYGYVRSGHVLAARDDSDIDTMDDLVALMEEGTLDVGTFGRGSSGHLQIVAALDEVGLLESANFVHFEGSAPLATALLGGHVDVGIMGTGLFSRTDDVHGLMNFAEAQGETEALADVPIPSGSGYENLPLFEQFFAMLAPPDVPTDVLAELEAAFDRALQNEDVLAEFERLELEPTRLGSDELRERVHQYLESAETYEDIMLR